MTKKQTEMFNFLYQHPYTCYYCISENLNIDLTIATRRANSLWKVKRAIDKWTEEPCRICGATGRYTFTVKEELVQTAENT